MNTEDLCLSLIHTDEEAEAVELLMKAGYWNNPTSWKLYGNKENNFATIGSQQTKPESALVEKLVNSVDAVLIRECLLKGVDPQSSQAPQSISEAVERFFDVYKGNLANIDPSTRTKLAENILLVATGSKSNPSYSVIDRGEGQTPNTMENTFLSLTEKSNKLRIPFVQGKFNMGGTGVLRFCSEQYNLQLIVTKRNPIIAQNMSNDPSASKWGFTIVRRENPSQGRRSSTYTFLAPNDRILSFDAESIPVIPGKYPQAYSNPLEWGSFIKLFEYRMTGLRTALMLDPYNRLSLLIPYVALPIRLVERRPGYTAHTPEVTLSGLSVRLEEDKRENLEPGFPSSGSITARGQRMTVLVFAFKKDSAEKYRRNEGIIFVVNGQTHGRLTTDFFTRKNVGLHYLSSSLLVVIDCSTFEGRAREDLFMNNREQLEDGDFRSEIEDQLEELLKQHQGLRELKERRRREEIQSKLEDSKPLAEVLDNIIKRSPALASLFAIGTRISNPFSTVKIKGTGEFVGRRHPTYFTLVNDNGSTFKKHCPINRRFRVQFKTDVENEYFVRDNSPGEFKLEIDGRKTNDYIINLWNGIGNLTVHLPSGSSVNQRLSCTSSVTDDTLINPFVNQFDVLVEEKAKPNRSTGGGTRKKSNGTNGDEAEKLSSLALPDVIEVRQAEWPSHKFDRFSAMKVMDNGEGGYDFFVNMDNVFLLTELKSRGAQDPKLLDAQYSMHWY